MLVKWKVYVWKVENESALTLFASLIYRFMSSREEVKRVLSEKINLFKTIDLTTTDTEIFCVPTLLLCSNGSSFLWFENPPKSF